MPIRCEPCAAPNHAACAGGGVAPLAPEASAGSRWNRQACRWSMKCSPESGKTRVLRHVRRSGVGYARIGIVIDASGLTASTRSLIDDGAGGGTAWRRRDLPWVLYLPRPARISAIRRPASTGPMRPLPVLDPRATAANHGDGSRSTRLPPLVRRLRAHEQCN